MANLQTLQTQIESEYPQIFLTFGTFTVSLLPNIIRIAMEVVEEKELSGTDKASLALQLVTSFLSELKNDQKISQETYAIASTVLTEVGLNIVNLAIYVSKGLSNLNAYLKKEEQTLCSRIKSKKRKIAPTKVTK